MINRVVLVGRLARDPELKTTTTGKSICEFTIAVNRPGKDSGADFFRCTAWEKTADYVAQYLAKGRLIAVDGSLRVESWEKDGQKHSMVKVIAGSVQSLEKAPEGSQADTRPSATTTAAADEYDPFADD